MGAGITAGSIAAIIAVLVSLPLRSPYDALINSATVSIGTIVVGSSAGLFWDKLANSTTRIFKFSVSTVVAFGLFAIFAVAVETQLDNFTAFALPLAAIVLSVTWMLIVLLARTSVADRRWVPAAAVVIALAVGISLAGQGDQESGRLELPPKSGLTVPVVKGKPV